MGTKICVASQKKRDKKKGLKDGSLLTMFSRMTQHPAPTPVPSTTCAPEPLPVTVQPPRQATIIADASIELPTSRENSVEVVDPQTHSISNQIIGPLPMDAPVSSLVDELKVLAQRVCVEAFTRDILDMEVDPLATFDVNPAAFDDQSISTDDLWEEVLNGVMKNGLGWGTELDVSSLLKTDGSGLMGLVNFVEYFVVKHSVNEGLFEGKLAHLLSGLRLL